MLEGTDPGAVIIIDFPNRNSVEAWYRSEAYQAIIPLRTENSDGIVLALEGVDDDHVATDVLQQT